VVLYASNLIKLFALGGYDCFPTQGGQAGPLGQSRKRISPKARGYDPFSVHLAKVGMIHIRAQSGSAAIGPFSDSLLRGIAPREADIRLTTLLWPSALACLSAKSRRRARAQTGPSCAVDDPNEDGDSDYCEGSDDRGSSGPNAVFAAALLTSNSTLRTIANAGISPSTETPRPPASLNFAEPVASSVGAFRSAMLNFEKRDRVLRR